MSKRSDSVGGFPSSAYSVLLRFRRSRSHEARGNAESGLATSNNEVSSDEQATKCSGADLIKEHPWASHTTAATCASTSVGCSTKYSQDQEEQSCHPNRDHDMTATEPTFNPSEISHQLSKPLFLSTRDLAYWDIRKVFRE